MSTHIEAAVARILEARMGGPAIPVDFVQAHPLSLAEGQEVAAKVQVTWGPVGGWKVTAASTKERPTWSPVFSKDIFGSPAKFARGTFRQIGIECEIAYRMAKDLNRPPYTRDQIVDAIAGILPLVEIVDTRLADRKSASDGWKYAEGGGNGAFLIGHQISDWRHINTQDQPVALNFNGKTVADKPGNPAPDLVLAVMAIANQAGVYCGGIRAGQIVTTGTMTGNIPTEPGTEVVAKFAHLGELRAIFE
jgi:2-keto-4-pentenoate hydratase